MCTPIDLPVLAIFSLIHIPVSEIQRANMLYIRS